jgi:hypothetical protein
VLAVICVLVICFCAKLSVFGQAKYLPKLERIAKIDN